MAENEVFQISNMDALTVLSIWDTDHDDIPPRKFHPS